MAAALVLFLLAAPAPEIPVRAGAPIRLDAAVEEAEWADAFAVSRERPSGGAIRLLLKRTGPWLALGIDAEQAYRGEILKVNVTDRTGAWVTQVTLGLGQPTLPPGLWRRGAPERFDDPGLSPGPPARACLVRVDVDAAERWSAEALVRLGALGVGRGDLRDLRGFVTLEANDPKRRVILTLPEGARDPHDTAQYARLSSPDGWGVAESWPSLTPAESKELDDGDLLHRLCLELVRVMREEVPDQLVVGSAVRPRTMTRVNALRRQIEEGRARNPKLPAWTYFLGRLLHAANLFDEARQVVESVPAPLRPLEPFASFAAEHYLDTGRFDLVEQVCRDHPYISMRDTVLGLALEGKRQQEKEREAIAKDEAKEEKNPRVRFRTSKGDLVVELFEDDAPGMVRNFMDLVLRRRFYDGLRFHDVHGARFAAIGDPRTRLGSTDTTAGPGFRLRVDPSERGLLAGYLVAQPTADKAWHGSQFQFALVPLLADTAHTFSFGRVVEGMGTLYRLEQDDLLEKVEVISRRDHAYDASAARLSR